MKCKSILLFAFALALLSVTACKQNPASLRASLMAAVRADNTVAALRLIQKGADPNSRTSPSGWSALHYAVRNGNTQIVEALLKAGADPNYAGNIESQQGAAVSLQPLPLAEAALDFASQVPPSRADTLLRQAGLNDPALLKSMRDAKASIRYQRVVDDLAKSSQESLAVASYKHSVTD